MGSMTSAHEASQEAGAGSRVGWVETPLGSVLVTCEGESLTGLRFADGAGPAPGGAAGSDDAIVESARRQLGEYFAGLRTDFELELRPAGTSFQLSVWAQLAAIPHGQVTTYREIAQRVGRPRAVRAVGAAIGRNPIAIVIPCHRVIGSDGGLTGYAGGLARKRRLLAHERGRSAAAPAEVAAGVPGAPWPPRCRRASS